MQSDHHNHIDSDTAERWPSRTGRAAMSQATLAKSGPAAGTAEAEAGPSTFAGSMDFIPFDFDEKSGDGNDGKEENDRAGQPAEKPSGRPAGRDAKREPSRTEASKHAKKRKFDGRDREDDESRGNGRRDDNARSSKKYVPPSLAKRERRKAASGTPWCESVDFASCSNAVEMLHEELAAFAEWMTPSEKEHDARQMVISLIGRAIVKEWPDARVEAFGSQRTQLYMPQGDIDLVVVSDAMESQRREQVLRRMAAVLRRNNLATDVQVIAKAKVPIVKFVCTLGRLKVDISVNQTNGIDASHFVHDCLELYPAIRPLIMATKLLLSQRGLSEVFSGGLGSYSVICLVISHFQMHPKLQRGEIDPALNLGILFLEFLELYGKNFGYDNVGISVRDRGSYFSKVSRGWRDERRAFMLSVEDPLDPSNDISKGSFAIIQVRSALSGAFDILTATICQRANETMQQRARRDWQDGKEDEEELARKAVLDSARRASNETFNTNKDPQSLLGTIVGVSWDMVKQKRELERLWESGTLQHRLGRPPPGRSPEPLSRAESSHRGGDERRDSGQKLNGNARTQEGQRGQSKYTTTNAESVDQSDRARGVREPIVIHDDSGRPSGDSDQESSIMMNEEEFAASQGIQFSSSTRASSVPDKEKSEHGDAKDDDDSDQDSRYTAEQNGRQTNGATRQQSRFDAFAQRAPQAYVDDDEEEEESDAGGEKRAVVDDNVSNRAAGTSTSLDADARRQRKNDFWASKGNAVSSQSKDDDESEDSEAGDVMLNIYE